MLKSHVNCQVAKSKQNFLLKLQGGVEVMKLSKTKKVYLTSKAKKLLSVSSKNFPALIMLSFVCTSIQFCLTTLQDVNQLTWQTIAQILLIVLSGLSSGGIFVLYALYDAYKNEAEEERLSYAIKAKLLQVLICINLILTLLLNQGGMKQ